MFVCFFFCLCDAQSGCSSRLIQQEILIYGTKSNTKGLSFSFLRDFFFHLKLCLVSALSERKHVIQYVEKWRNRMVCALYFGKATGVFVCVCVRERERDGGEEKVNEMLKPVWDEKPFNSGRFCGNLLNNSSCCWRRRFRQSDLFVGSQASACIKCRSVKMSFSWGQFTSEALFAFLMEGCSFCFKSIQMGAVLLNAPDQSGSIMPVWWYINLKYNLLSCC